MISVTPGMELVMMLSSVQSHLIKKVERQLSIHGISYTELMVMYQLNSAPNRTMQRIVLAENIGLSASGVTRLINPMEKRHIVEKESNPRDARVSLVRLSDTGQKLFYDALKSFQQSSDALSKNMDSKQIETLLELIGLLD